MPVLDPETIERSRVNGDSRFEAQSHLGDRGD
jgi:hypothetical protein